MASTRALTAAEKERTKQNSVFLSQTDRFMTYDKLHGLSQRASTRAKDGGGIKSEMGSLGKG